MRAPAHLPFQNYKSAYGIEPSLLLKQVRNAAGYLFQNASSTEKAELDFVRILQTYENSKCADLDLPTYFELCLSAHFATVGSFVPTDLDQTIRVKLWQRACTADEVEKMALSVLRFLEWNDRPVSKKQVGEAGLYLTGHHGEWFSVVVAALVRCDDFGIFSLKEKLVARIEELIEWHQNVFAQLLRKNDAIQVLQASTLIAHNFGDWDRALDLWKVNSAEPLRSRWYKLSQIQQPRYRGLFIAGEVNRQMMAAENHRHFALRKPRGLRNSADLLLPIAPFLDGWGGIVGKHPAVSENELGEIAEALVDGWSKLNETKEVFGYARALAGIIQSIPGGLNELAKRLPAAKRKIITSGKLRTMLSIDHQRFEASWRARAEKLIRTLSN